MSNSQAAVRESWLVIWSPHASEFSWAIYMIWTMGGSPLCSNRAPWSSCPYPSYLHSQLYLPNEPILNKFPQWHNQGLPLNHNSPPTRTFSIVPSCGDSPTLPPHSILPQSHPKELALSVDHVCCRITSWLCMAKINTSFINKDFTKTFFHIIQFNTYTNFSGYLYTLNWQLPFLVCKQNT